jgi:hypothetical protein
VADSESGYKVGPGRPPPHTRFQKGQSGNPGGRPPEVITKDATVIAVGADGKRRTLRQGIGQWMCIPGYPDPARPAPMRGEDKMKMDKAAVLMGRLASHPNFEFSFRTLPKLDGADIPPFSTVYRKAVQPHV